MPVAPSVELIASKQLVEGADYEFKRQLNFNDEGKSNLVDDVVAFLNTEKAGHIIVGIKEDKGGFDGFAPILEDPDQLVRRVQSLLQDKIVPRPLSIEVRALPVDGGSILDIAIGEHRMGPYQNLFTGGFMVRTGAKNTPVKREELAAYFVDRDRFDQTLRGRMAQEQGALAAEWILAPTGALLEIGILPREHFDRGRAPFDQSGNLLRGAPGYHHGNDQLLKGCGAGHEAIEIDLYEKAISRVLIADDWFIHAAVVHPIGYEGSGRVKIHEFKAELTDYLESLETLARREGLQGPFGVHLNLSRLKANEKVGWVFDRADRLALPRPTWSERIADSEMIEQFHRRLVSISRYR